MFNQEGTQIVTNFLNNKYYRGFTFRNTTAGIYRLEITVPKDKKSTSLAMASRKFEEKEQVVIKPDADGYRKVKTYNLNKTDVKSYEYTVVFSEGTEYKLTFEEENTKAQLISEDREKTLVDFTSTSSEKAIKFKIAETGVYYIKMEKEGQDSSNVDLSFKRETK